MQIMGCRYFSLVETVKVLSETGLYLLVKVNGLFSFVGDLAFDDIGTYYFIPFLMKTLDISLDHSIDLFYYGLIFVGLAVLIGAFSFLGGLWLGLFSLCSFFIIYREGFFRLTDLYIVNIFCTFLMVPLFLLVLDHFKRANYTSCAILFILGLVAGYSHSMRMYSSLPAVFFIGSSLVSFFKKKHLYILSFFLIGGIGVSSLHMRYLVFKAKTFLSTQGVHSVTSVKHPFWHPIYGGIGFLENHLGITFDDENIINKVKNIDPIIKPYSAEYEQVLRKEVFNLLYKERFLVFSAMFAKIGIILLFLLICSNIGLLAAYLSPKGKLEYIFWSSMALSGLPGILVLPRASYLSGFAAFAFVYGIYSVIFYLKNKQKL